MLGGCEDAGALARAFRIRSERRQRLFRGHALPAGQPVQRCTQGRFAAWRSQLGQRNRRLNRHASACRRIDRGLSRLGRQAFDFVEIGDGTGTTPPPTFPGTSGTDSLVFLGNLQGTIVPGRFEPGAGDPAGGVPLSGIPAASKRPAVTTT